MNLKNYYGAEGSYLRDHKQFFSKKQLNQDVDFLIDVLNLNKKDKILDLACGQGRHTIELTKRGYHAEGLDFSNHLLKIAKQNSEKQNLKINFYKQNIHDIKLKKKYNKIFLFFSEFGLFNPDKVLHNVTKLLKKNGLFLLDCDNVFRLVQYLAKHPKDPFEFDFINMELKERQNNQTGVKYYTVPELRRLFANHNLKIKSIYGDYKKNKLKLNSNRIIITGKK